MKNKLFKIKNLKHGDKIKGFFIVRSYQNKVSRLGDEYVDLILEDSTGQIRGKIWSYVNHYKPLLEQFVPVAVKGKIITFNDSLEIDVSFISQIKNDLYDKYGYNIDMLFKHSTKHMKGQLKVLTSYIDKLSIANKNILLKIISDYKTKIMLLPSIYKTYKYKGGYLNQICSVLNLHNRIYTQYEMKSQSIIVGIILKNIGLLEYFNNNISFSVSEKNKSTGYRILGIKLVDKYFNHSDETFEFINNLIISDINSDNRLIRHINFLYEFDSNMLQS